MREVVNEQTGEVNIQFGGKLISISEKVLQNSNKKNYKVATIEFETKEGKEARCTALVYEGNYSKGVKIGETYLCTASPTEQNPIVQMSHLSYTGERATAEMFGFEVKAESTDPVTEPNKVFETQE